VDKVDGAVNGVEDPPGAVLVASGALFLAEESDVGGGSLEVIAQATFDVDVELGGIVSLAFWSELAVPIGVAEDLYGQIDRLVSDGEEVLGRG
jgi:hypothetical protein